MLGWIIFQNFFTAHCWKTFEIRYNIPYGITHLTLGMLLHYLEKLKI